MTDLTRTSPAENLDLLAARLSDHLSPAEKDELREAATLLRSPAVPEGCVVVPRDELEAAHERWNGNINESAMLDALDNYDNEISRWLSAAPPAGWVSVKDRLPDVGQLIVKRWRAKNSVWAGIYTGGEKDSSFDDWILLPTLSGESAK